MSNTVIKVENLSKQYRLGTVGTGTLSHDLNRFWARIRGKEDPYLKIGESNDRTTKAQSDYVWALKDINFEVKQGEVLGIIGRNGAGKSTLLKILSQITRPTTGNVKMKGRVGSLLEVGTGFHPDLTGRENIYINGAILGMRKKEIDRKLDEIIDFAGVERYIDTPVKRYSSGMKVRLGFSVAAHLEPEILIVDEVLAVGDAEFQKRCLGKMGDVSRYEGRTILFVSHNLGSLYQLCSKATIIHEGKSIYNGDIDNAISKYLKVKDDYNEENLERFRILKDLPRTIEFTKVNFQNKTNIFQTNETIRFFITVRSRENVQNFRFSFTIANKLGSVVGSGYTETNLSINNSEEKQFQIEIENEVLVPGTYSIKLAVGIGNPTLSSLNFDLLNDILSFEITSPTGVDMVPVWKLDWGSVFFKKVYVTEKPLGFEF